MLKSVIMLEKMEGSQGSYLEKLSYFRDVRIVYHRILFSQPMASIFCRHHGFAGLFRECIDGGSFSQVVGDHDDELRDDS